MSSSRIIFIAFAVLYVALVWTGRYVPTQDGPSHLANAAALRDVLLPGDQGLEAAYSAAVIVEMLGLPALPFAVALPFHMGFFNYCAGVVVMLAALAYFWPRRDRLRVREAVVLNLLAAAAYFCHLLPALLLLGAVYFLNVALPAGIVPGERSGGGGHAVRAGAVAHA